MNVPFFPSSVVVNKSYMQFNEFINLIKQSIVKHSHLRLLQQQCHLLSIDKSKIRQKCRGYNNEGIRQDGAQSKVQRRKTSLQQSKASESI